MADDLEKLQQEINEAFRKEGEKVVREEIAANEERLRGIRVALRIFDRFGGDGLADAMPIGEVVGFLEVKIEMADRGYDPGIPREEIERAKDFLVGIIGEEYPEKMELGALVERLKQEEKDILT